MNEDVAVTAVVPVKDRRESMLRCLDALLAQDHPAYEVVVLDNGSRDGTAQACRERARQAQVPVRVEVMEGTVGRLRNRAAELARGEVVAYTDSDCVPVPGWLRAGTAALGADPGLGIVAGRTLPDPAVPQRPGAATLEVREPNRRFESANLFVRREALLASDGFHEEVGHFWEDTAAGWGILRAGWRAGWAPDAVVHHEVTHPGLGWWLRRAQRYGNAAAVVRRYPELRRELLWGRYFLRPRSAITAAAVAGVALAPLDRRALALAAPFAWMRRPRALSAGAVRAAGEAALFDLAIFAGTVRGSARWRCLVL